MTLRSNFTDRLDDAELRSLAKNATVRFSFVSRGAGRATFDFLDGELELAPDGPGNDIADIAQEDFSVVLDEADWSDLLCGDPTPRRQSVLAYLRPELGGELVGCPRKFAQYLHLVRRLIEIARPARPGPARPEPTIETAELAMIGGYVRTVIPGWGTSDLYYESVGDGPAVVLLPTAGSDVSQYHGVMSDPDLASRYTFYAMDLPSHGNSSAVFGEAPTEYALDSHRYGAVLAGFIQTLGINRPEKVIVVGVSMAGAVVVEFAARHPELTRGVVDCQVGPRVAKRRTPWLRDAEINQALHVPEWTFGLMNPKSPKPCRDRVWWAHSRGGFGIYDSDLGYYTGSWDIDNVMHLLTPASPPVILMSGVYDYTVPPAATQQLASLIPTATFHEMPELGHFPHAENPPVFAGHLRWASPGSSKPTRKVHVRARTGQRRMRPWVVAVATADVRELALSLV